MRLASLSPFVLASAFALAAGCDTSAPAGDEVLASSAQSLDACVSPALLCNVGFFSSWPSGLDGAKGYSDRVIYSQADEAGQFVYDFADPALATRPGTTLELRLDGATTPTLSVPHRADFSPYVEVTVAMNKLTIGDHTLTATLVDGATSSSLTVSFRREEGPVKVPLFPSAGVELYPQRDARVANVSVPITTGIPFPERMLPDTTRLILEENGVRVPVQFTVRSRWRAGGSIRWLGLDFFAKYDGATPRRYVLRQLASPPVALPSPLSVSVSNGVITVNNAPMRAALAQTGFRGLTNLSYDINGDGTFSALENALVGYGGPFVVSARGEVATPDPAAAVQVVESGPVRATLRIEAPYRTATRVLPTRMVTYLTFFAGDPTAYVSHRTILGSDPETDTIADVAWEQPLRNGSGTVTFGEADGAASPIVAPMPTLGTVFVHQETPSQFRVVQSGVRPAFGRHAATMEAKPPTTSALPRITLAMRDMAQRYPKELEVQGTGQRAVAHFWPRHGTTPFTSSADDTSRANIYKLRYAHQGSRISFPVPADYLNAAQTYLKQDSTGDDLSLQMAALTSSSPIGLAVGADFAMRVAPNAAGADTANAAALAAYLAAVHAIASPAWNAQSGALGDVLPPSADPAVAGSAADDKLATIYRTADASYQRAVLEGAASDEYGMWIYGNTHNAYDANHGQASGIHRVWQQSHYQGVSAGWFRYLLTGDRDQYRWARANSTHFMDIATRNAEGANGAGRTGEVSHVKGFFPWGGATNGEYSALAHWIDPDAYLYRYYITGDLRARDLAATWFERTVVEDFSPWPAGTSGCGSSFRDRVVHVGAFVEYYRATQDPRALAMVRAHTENLLDVALECTDGPNEHPIWGDRWFERVYSMTRDPRVVARMRAWTAAGFDDPAVNAFVYLNASPRDVTLLDRLTPVLYDHSRTRYDAPGERYDGYGEHFSAADARWLLGVPHFVKALATAGRSFARGERRGTYPGRPSRYATPFPNHARGWSNAGTIVLIDPTSGPSGDAGAGSIPVTIAPLTGYSDPSTKDPSVYFMKPQVQADVGGLQVPPFALQHGTFGTSLLATMITGANPSLMPTAPTAFTLQTVDSHLHRVEIVGTTSDALAPLSDFAEASILTRMYQYSGLQDCQERFFAVGPRHTFYMRPAPTLTLEPTYVVRVGGGYDKNVEESGAAYGRSWPAYFRIASTDGLDVRDGTVFKFGGRPTVSVTLDSSKTYSFYSATNYGHDISLTAGADELLLVTAVDKQGAAVPSAVADARFSAIAAHGFAPAIRVDYLACGATGVPR